LFGPVSIVVCGSKSDLENRKVSPERISNFLRVVPEIYFDISSKSNYNFDKPILYILRQLLTTGDKSYCQLMNSPINFSDIV
jgi:GTP-binding nuclear protein Ran